MSPRRDGAPTIEVRATAQLWTSCDHSNAVLRTEALYLGLSAVAEGIWEPTQTLLDALASLAGAVSWDLAGAA
jgi:hypothetical protein